MSALGFLSGVVIGGVGALTLKRLAVLIADPHTVPDVPPPPPPAPVQPDDPYHQIQAALRQRGMSINGWARAHGFHARTVHTVLERWAGRTDRPPHGGLARQIMAQLRQDLGPELVPEPNPLAKEEVA